jgi:hypothetical protein
MQNFCGLLNRTRYDVSTSTRETNKAHWGITGTREVWDMSDLNQDLRYDAMTSNSVVTMVDVDYHLSEKDWSKYNGKPILIYTSIPNSLGSKTPNGSYYFTDENTFVEDVAGGARYESSVWDFSPDLLIIKSWFSFTQYACEKISQPESINRALVYLCPRVTMYVPYWLFQMYAKLANISLKRSEPIARARNITESNGVLLGRFVVNGNKFISLKETDSDHEFSTNIPEKLWDSLYRIKCVSKTFMLGDVQRICEASKQGKKLTQLDFSLIAKALNVGITSRFLINFQSYGGEDMLDLEEPKAIAKVAAEPIVTETAKAACDTRNNEILCIEERVTKMANDVQPPERYIGWRDEFLKRLIPVENIGVPVDMDVVIEKQDSKAQRARQKQEQNHVRRKNVCNAFVKNELSDKISPAHNISGMRQDHTLALSRFSYGFKAQVMKQHAFYAPGNSPNEIVDKIRNYATLIKLDVKAELIETDFTRFDATMSPFLRELEFMAYRRWVAGKYLKELDILLIGEINLSCYSKHGTKYKQRSSRCSGSPLTTEGNTIVNAFIAFCAYRAAGFDADKSFALIGPKYGDDGVDSSRGKFALVAKELGLTIKLLTPGPNVSFLGRIFLDVYNYNTTLSAPVKLLKRACVVNKLHDPKALADRVNGYLITDQHVPLIGHYLAALKRVYKLGQCNDVENMEHDVKYRHKNGPYPVDVSCEHDRAMVHCVANLLGLLDVEVIRLAKALNAARTEEDLKNIKVFVKGVEDPTFKFYCV